MSEHRERDDALAPSVEEAARRLARPVPASPSLVPNVMAAIDRRGLPRRGAMRRLLQRRMLRLSPVQIGLMAASIALAGVFVGRYSRWGIERHESWAAGQSALALTATAGITPGPLTIAVEVHPRGVRFVLSAPEVRNVSLVGDFNGWRADATPLVRDPTTGLWTVDLPISAGRYSYAFVVDGRWMADPQSPRAPEDDFGRPNSVLVVNREASRT